MTTVIQPKTSVEVLGTSGGSALSGTTDIVPPPPVPFQQFLDDTFWVPQVNVVWNAGLQQWDMVSAGVNSITLGVITTGPNANWTTGLEPLLARVTLAIGATDATTLQVLLSDDPDGNDNFDQTVPVSSPAIIQGAVTNFPLNNIIDLTALKTFGSSTGILSITNIEFSL